MEQNDTNKYGVPEQKKFPLPDADHVRSAIKFFNYVEPRYEKELAKAILRKVREYNIDLSEMSIGDNNRFKKYLPNELKHYGILGQKWGVRNYENYDGTLTSEGKKRYYSSNKSSNIFDSDISDNKLTSEQKEKLKKAAIIGAAVVGSALVAYGGYRIYKSNRTIFEKEYGLARPKEKFDHNDKISNVLSNHPEVFSDNPINLDKGTTIQRISRDAYEDFEKKGQTYVSFKFRDNMIYKHGLPKEMIWGDNDAYVHKIKLKNELKAPSTRELAKIYSELYPKSSYSMFVMTVQNGFVDNLFNEDDDDPVSRITKSQNNNLKKELLKRGYNAIIDTEDANAFKSSRTIAPLIVLNPSYIFGEDSVHKLDSLESFAAKIFK